VKHDHVEAWQLKKMEPQQLWTCFKQVLRRAQHDSVSGDGSILKDLSVRPEPVEGVLLRFHQHKEEHMDGVIGLEKILMAFAAALALGLSALATAWAQAKIGAAGAGALAEKPELTATIIILVAIPETMVILGFVIAAMILLK